MIVEVIGTMPQRVTAGSVGYDLYSQDQVWLDDGETVRIPSGTRLRMPPGVWCEARPISSSSARGLLVHIGTVDNDYRGDLTIVATNLNCLIAEIAPGDRIAQLVFHPDPWIELVQVDSFDDETERGEGGFGSTGR